jgi:hypothetical protein
MDNNQQHENVNKGEAVAYLICALTACGLAAWFGFNVLGPSMLHRQKSDRQLCEERGGTYGELRGAGYRCFSPEAFK